MNLLNEELNNIKYLFGYKPGKVISEQDKVPTELRRRMSIIKQKFDEFLDGPDNNPSDFPDEFSYADSVIRGVIDELMEESDDDYFFDNEYEIIDFMKDKYGDFLFDIYNSESDDDDDDDYEDYEEDDY
jgi:hypothetical protein